MRGIIAYGTYLPYHRLQRDRISDALGTSAGSGTRAVAGYDEDTTSMAVEATRNALTMVDQAARPTRLLFATASPAYLDKTNACAIHAAVGLTSDAMALDTGGAIRSGMGSLFLAADASATTAAVASDIRTGRPGNAEETGGGDAAAAVIFGSEDVAPVLAEVLGTTTISAEIMDRWRLPGEDTASVWEERFGAFVYPDLVEQAVTGAVKDAGLSLDQVDRWVVTGTHTRAVRVASKLAPTREALVDDLAAVIGNSGTGHAPLLLCAALEAAEPDQIIAVVNLADGVDVMILKTTAAVTARRPRRLVQDWLTATDDTRLSYADFLTWRGFIDRQGPRRPAPNAPAAPPSARATGWKFGFVASRDLDSGAINMPPQRVSYDGGRTDNNQPVDMADATGRVRTFSIDHLAYSLAPPVVMAVIDFDGGGRVQCELTDLDPAAVVAGTPVEMTFRRMFTADGIHNYFWKGRPLRAVSDER